MENEIQYRIVYDDQLLRLEKVVAGLLNAGWECVGGVAIKRDPPIPTIFYQAVQRDKQRPL